MTELVSVGEPPITVVLRRSAQARQLTLRVPSIGGDPVLTAPRRAPRRLIDGFLAEREGWLRAALDRTPQPRTVADGALLPVEGRPLRLTVEARRGVIVDGDGLRAPRHGTAGAVQAFLKTLARDRLATATARHAGTLGLAPGRLTLRDPRSRWGSCTSEGNLMFSWRLIMAPPDVLDYVAAHEVAHLVEMNHSPDFWAVVERLRPDWRVHRDWLRVEGAALHRWRFTA